MNKSQIVRHPSLVSREQREAANGHRAAVVWFTGIPGSGKSTTAHEVERQLFAMGCQAYVLDGDNVRHGLSADLGFSPEHRSEHLRRIGELSRLIYDAGMIVLCAFVSPTRENRDKVRARIPAGAFFEIHCNCPAAVCAERDPKGFYKKAQAGEIKNYTGVSAPYEVPTAPELVLNTALHDSARCAAQVIDLLRAAGVLSDRNLTVSGRTGT
ncbi:MAG: adenylyl-sulfate kinase [Burkholderiales bacterium]|nr:adenylyl-sulfate kinase [Burkholderiales bacterium]